MVPVLAMWLTAGALSVFADTARTRQPLIQLLRDLDAAVARTPMTEAQREQLGSDRAVLDNARRAHERGAEVDRRQVAGAVKHLHKSVENNVFHPEMPRRLMPTSTLCDSRRSERGCCVLSGEIGLCPSSRSAEGGIGSAMLKVTKVVVV